MQQFQQILIQLLNKSSSFPEAYHTIFCVWILWTKANAQEHLWYYVQESNPRLLNKLASQKLDKVILFFMVLWAFFLSSLHLFLTLLQMPNCQVQFIGNFHTFKLWKTENPHSVVNCITLPYKITLYPTSYTVTPMPACIGEG